MWLWILSGIMALALPRYVALLRSSKAVGDFINGWPWLRRQVSNLVIHVTTSATPPRPNPHSLWTPPGEKPVPDWAVRGGSEQAGAAAARAANFVSWDSLINRRFVDRHLPPVAQDPVPSIEAITALFLRPEGAAMVPTDTGNSVFLAIFAQWFTDSFLRSDPTDLRCSTATHEIDFCQIYGLDEATCRSLRLGEHGLLRSRMTPTGEYPELLFENGQPRPVFADLVYCRVAAPGRPMMIDTALEGMFGRDPALLAARRATLYATGLERGSSNVGYAAVSTLFLREHNRLARKIQAGHKDWSDERVFAAARNTVIAVGLKIIIEEYIVQIAHTPIHLKLDPGFAVRQRWNRTNRIAIEFNLLYRWHSMVPDEVILDGVAQPFPMLQFNNAMLEQFGLEALVTALSNQRAGRIGIGNVPHWMKDAETSAHSMSRRFALAGMNDYRERFGLKRLASFEALTEDVALREKLSALYGGRIDAVELLPGLFAEGDRGDAAFGSLLLRMVGYDAFSQALTNPLLAPQLWNEATFSDIGWATIHATQRIDDVFRRNTNATAQQRASFAIPAQ